MKLISILAILISTLFLSFSLFANDITELEMANTSLSRAIQRAYSFDDPKQFDEAVNVEMKMQQYLEALELLNNQEYNQKRKGQTTKLETTKLLKLELSAKQLETLLEKAEKTKRELTSKNGMIRGEELEIKLRRLNEVSSQAKELLERTLREGVKRSARPRGK